MEKNKGKQRVLVDHHRVGKRFVPPFLHKLGQFGEVNWPDCILPELLWIGLLNRHLGFKEGTNLALSLAKAAVETFDELPKLWFAPTSSYGALTVEQRRMVTRTLKEFRHLDSLRKAIIPLGAFYPDCPLNFLFEGKLPEPKDSKEHLEELKEVVSSLFDRWDTPATRVQANAIYIAFVTGKLKVAAGTPLANFPAVADFPHTEESKIIASGARAMVNGFFGGEGLYDKSSFWPEYFWNRGLELEPCEIRGDDE